MNEWTRSEVREGEREGERTTSWAGRRWAAGWPGCPRCRRRCSRARAGGGGSSACSRRAGRSACALRAHTYSVSRSLSLSLTSIAARSNVERSEQRSGSDRHRSSSSSSSKSTWLQKHSYSVWIPSSVPSCPRMMLIEVRICCATGGDMAVPYTALCECTRRYSISRCAHRHTSSSCTSGSATAHILVGAHSSARQHSRPNESSQWERLESPNESSQWERLEFGVRASRAIKGCSLGAGWGCSREATALCSRRSGVNVAATVDCRCHGNSGTRRAVTRQRACACASESFQLALLFQYTSTLYVRLLQCNNHYYLECTWTTINYSTLKVDSSTIIISRAPSLQCSICNIAKYIHNPLTKHINICVHKQNARLTLDDLQKFLQALAYRKPC